MHEIIEGLQGVEVVADDFLVVGQHLYIMSLSWDLDQASHSKGTLTHSTNTILMEHLMHTYVDNLMYTIRKM